MRPLLLSMLCLGCTALLPEEVSSALTPTPPLATAPCLSEFDFNMDGVMDGRTTYQYNAKHQLIREDFTSLGHDALPTSTVYTYDPSGDLTDKTLLIEGKAYTRWSRRYEGKRLVQEENVMLVPACAAGPVIDREFTTAYIPGGDSDRPARAEEYVTERDLCNAGDGWVQTRTRYLYKEGAAPYQKQNEAPTYQKASSEYKVELSYDAEGRLAKELYTADTAPRGYAQVEYFYGATPPTKTIKYDWELDGVFESHTTLTFDEAGREQQEERFTGEALTWVKTTTYNALGQAIKEEVDGSGAAPRDGKADHQTLYQYQCDAVKGETR